MADNFDPAYEETEEKIAELEKKLQREYKRASQEADEKLKKYLEKFEKKDAEKKREMSYGLINEDEYNEWRQRQILQMDRYQAMVDTLAEEYVHANEQARAIIAGDMPEIYAINANFALYEIEGYGTISTSFSLYSAGAVRELALHDADLLPLPSQSRLAELKAKDMLWNRQLVSSSIMQSILAGESVPKMAKRLAASVGEKNYNSAVRAARTMSTAVQNKARVDQYVRAKEEGSKIQKQVWLATLDGRTRHAHRQLDQQETEVGEPWEVDGYKIRFPSDPAAPAYLIYNCRCRVRGVIEGLERISGKGRDYSAIGGQSYEEWKKGKAKGESQRRIDEREERAREAKKPEPVVIDESKYRSATNGTEANDIFYNDRSFIKWDNDLSYEQKQSVFHYSQGGYRAINETLRNGKTFNLEELGSFYGSTDYTLTKEVKQIDKAIEKYDLKNPIKVYRTCEREFVDELKVGERWRDKGFVSTSLIPDPQASGDVRLEILVDAGKGQGAYINKLSAFEDREYEFLIGRGGVFEPYEITKGDDGSVLCKMRLVGFDKDYEFEAFTGDQVLKIWDKLDAQGKDVWDWIDEEEEKWKKKKSGQ